MSAQFPTPLEAIGKLTADNNHLRSILEDVDAAIATLYIGRDHGITPQADGALREAVIRLRDATYTSDTLREVWAEARASWERKGSADACRIPPFRVQVLAELANWYKHTCADPQADTLLADARRILADAGVQL